MSCRGSLVFGALAGPRGAVQCSGLCESNLCRQRRESLDKMGSITIGVLGAARIVRTALLVPAARVPGVAVGAIAARDPERAKKYASKHHISVVHSSYEELLADGNIDAVYIPTPPALHGRWIQAAASAGKSVLVEKPFVANAQEARALVAEVSKKNVIVMEAFHSLYHPLVDQLRGIIASGELGTLQSATAVFCAPIPPGRDIRWNAALGGGALMDLGCYPIRVLQALFGYDVRVNHARAKARDGVDRVIVAELSMERIPSATVLASMWSHRLFSSKLTIAGSSGTLSVAWPYQPQHGARIKIRSVAGARSLSVERTPTYEFQLRAFRDAVTDRKPPATSLAESLGMMAVIDAIYQRAGLAVRQPFAD